MAAAVKDHPGSPEGHYFLGYTIDRMNANEGAGMHRITKALTLLASEQFELVTRLEKKYTGEMLARDPYSKIGSIWGSLAQAYLARQLPDSAALSLCAGEATRRLPGAFVFVQTAISQQLHQKQHPVYRGRQYQFSLLVFSGH